MFVLIRNNNYIDQEFNVFIDYIKSKNIEEVTEIIKNNFEYYNKYDHQRFKGIIDFYNDHKLWGEINLEDGNFELIENNAESLVNHLIDYEWFYNQLCDYRSKKILISVLNYWLMLKSEKIESLIDNNYHQYFDLDLIGCDKNEIFVDVGAYIGDTTIDYVRTFGEDCFKQIFCYEIVPANIRYIKDNINLFNLKKVSIRKKGVAEKEGKLFLSKDEVSSITKLENNGDIEIETVTIDKDIKGRVSFIKMDIEGGELSALLGCREKICKYHPKLAISVYHNNNHLWQIPKLIYEIDNSYKFYLRYYGGPILPTEYILYAI